VQPIVACITIVKLLLFIYSFQFRSTFRATTMPSQPRPLPSLTYSWTHLWFKKYSIYYSHPCKIITLSDVGLLSNDFRSGWSMSIGTMLYPSVHTIQEQGILYNSLIGGVISRSILSPYHVMRDDVTRGVTWRKSAICQPTWRNVTRSDMQWINSTATCQQIINESLERQVYMPVQVLL